MALLFLDDIMNESARKFSRAVIVQVNKDFTAQKRVDMNTLPNTVSESIRAHRFGAERLNQSFAAARSRVLSHTA